MNSIMRFIRELMAALPRQARRLALVVPIVAGLTAVLLLVVGMQRFVPVQFLVRDPSQTAKYPFYIGIVSYIGVIGWLSAAAIGLFAGLLTTDRAARFVLLTGGILSGLLGLDDLLTLHESALPDYVGISETAVLAVYALVAVVLLLGGLRYLLQQTDYLLLGLAFAFFAASLVFDTGFLNQGLNYLLEDGLKLFGIMFWATFVIRTARDALRPAPPTRQPPIATASFAATSAEGAPTR